MIYHGFNSGIIEYKPSSSFSKIVLFLNPAHPIFSSSQVRKFAVRSSLRLFFCVWTVPNKCTWYHLPSLSFCACLTVFKKTPNASASKGHASRLATFHTAGYISTKSKKGGYFALFERVSLHTLQTRIRIYLPPKHFGIKCSRVNRTPILWQ